MMAQRYRGKYSPKSKDGTPGVHASDAKIPMREKHRAGAGWRVNLLFFAPLPLAFRAFWQPPAGLALMLAAFGMLLLGAWLTRAGLIAQTAFEARKIARHPAIPRKIFGAVTMGAGLFLAGFATHTGLLGPVVFAFLGVALHLFSFGLDPLHNKGMDGIDGFQTRRVARAVEEGDAYLVAMSDAIKRAGDRKMEARVAQFQTTARDLFHTVEDDPRDLTAARKYMTVYLMGARDATVKFADIYARNQSAGTRADYTALLDDLEKNFTARTKALLLDDKADLTIEIDVLRERLQRDGIRAE